MKMASWNNNYQPLWMTAQAWWSSTWWIDPRRFRKNVMGVGSGQNLIRLITISSTAGSQKHNQLGYLNCMHVDGKKTRHASKQPRKNLASWNLAFITCLEQCRVAFCSEEHGQSCHWVITLQTIFFSSAFVGNLNLHDYEMLVIRLDTLGAWSNTCVLVVDSWCRKLSVTSHDVI